jgi:hypothetical protein
MKIVLKESTSTRTGISVVKADGCIETFNVLGKRIHSIESLYCQFGILTHRWFGEVFDEEIKEILGGHFVDAFIENRCSKILADLSQWSVSWDGVNDWLRDDLMPRLEEAGLTRLAVFVKGDPAAVMDANRLALERFENENQHINATLFSEQKALEWLRSNK